MCGSHHTCACIGHQHRRAVGGEDTEGNTRHLGGHGVGRGRSALLPGFGDVYGGSRVLLMKADQSGIRRAQPVQRPTPVFRNPPNLIAGTIAAVERGISALANAAFRAQKTVANEIMAG